MPRLLKSAGFWSVCLVVLALIGIFILADKYVAARHLPWKPLSLQDEMGWATRSQLFRLSLSPRSQCLQLLEQQASGIDFVTLPEKRNAQGCGFNVGISATQSRDIAYRPAELTTTCPMAAAGQIWLREINRLAQDIFDSPLAQIHHYGSYSCRKVAGTSRWSEHAFANAWDIAGFQLEDGRLISVLKDWNGNNLERQEFLRGARDTACRLYRVTLSPDYNAAHADHFHLDMGPSTTCR